MCNKIIIFLEDGISDSNQLIDCIAKLNSDFKIIKTNKIGVAEKIIAEYNNDICLLFIDLVNEKRYRLLRRLINLNTDFPIITTITSVHVTIKSLIKKIKNNKFYLSNITVIKRNIDIKIKVAMINNFIKLKMRM